MANEFKLVNALEINDEFLVKYTHGDYVARVDAIHPHRSGKLVICAVLENGMELEMGMREFDEVELV